jgi:hypothetical protein
LGFTETAPGWTFAVDLALLGVELAGQLGLDRLLQLGLLLLVDVERDRPAARV